MNACEYLAQVGFRLLRGEPTDWEDDTPQAEEAAARADHWRVKAILGDIGATAIRNGVCLRSPWFEPMNITWPDRLPDLKTWAGQQTLDKIVAKLVQAISQAEGDNLFSLRMPMKGATGFDSLSCPDAIDCGFSPAALDMEVVQRPALELLAIIGLESLPLISFGHRQCGFIHGDLTWRFPVEPRDGGYYHRWGNLSRV